VVGPVLNPGFSFPPGAVAVHIYSFSAGSMKRGWVASLVGAGAAATLGHVYEPYLQLTHDLSLFFEVIEAGGSVGEATWYSIPGQSWQGILVGDPLYRPFLRRFESQWAEQDDYDVDEQYLVMRKANLLLQDGKGEASTRFLEEEAEGGVTGLALAYRLAVESGNPDWLNEVAERARAELSPNEWGLALVAAELLEERDRTVSALDVFENLLFLTEGLEEWQNLLLRRAIQVARRLEDQARLDALEARLVPEPES
jgi:hypothetical protein